MKPWWILLCVLIAPVQTRGSGWGGEMSTVAVEAKLDGIEFDAFVLDRATLSQAVDLIRKKMKVGGDELRIGYERVRVTDVERLVSTKLEKVRLGEVLEAIGDATGRVLDVHHDGVTLRRVPGSGVPLLKPTDSMLVREFSLPRMTHEMICWRNYGGAGVADDPFAIEEGVDDWVPATIQEVLERNGVEFPEGAELVYSAIWLVRVREGAW